MIITTRDKKVLGSSYRVFDISSVSENDIFSLKPDLESHLIWERYKGNPSDNALKHYVKTYYEKCLKRYDPDYIKEKLAGLILYSNEPNRNIIAAWLELLLEEDAEIYEAEIKDGELVIRFETDKEKDELKNKAKAILAEHLGVEQKTKGKEESKTKRQDKLVRDGYELLMKQYLKKMRKKKQNK